MKQNRSTTPPLALEHEFAYNESVMNSDDTREFLLAVRRGLLFIVRWIEERYGLIPPSE